MLPWIEKYRPKTLSEVVANDDIVDTLKNIAKNGNMPHLLLSGPPGTGKTTVVHCLARELLNDDALLKDAVLELNASDERGIDVVRETIKGFAQKKVTLPQGRHKIIILDEADSMTKSAQQALRRTMELYSATTRFALICNYSSEIIEPIQSRCAIVRFTTIPDKDIIKRVKEIASLEELPYTEEGLSALTFTSEGDMRQALNTAQSVKMGFGVLNAENVYKVVDQPHPTALKESLRNLLASNLDGAIYPLVKLYYQGYPPVDIISSYFKTIKSFQMDEYLRLEFIKKIGMSQSAAGMLQLSTLAQMVGVVSDLYLIVEEQAKK